MSNVNIQSIIEVIQNFPVTENTLKRITEDLVCMTEATTKHQASIRYAIVQGEINVLHTQALISDSAFIGISDRISEIYQPLARALLMKEIAEEVNLAWEPA